MSRELLQRALDALMCATTFSNRGQRNRCPQVIADLRAELATPAPIDMVLHCPACGLQHVDAPDTDAHVHSDGRESMWTNPPHRSHLCHGCGHIWRPADVPTNGVQAAKTKGKADSPPVMRTDGTSTTAFDDQFAPESVVRMEPTDAQIEAIMPRYLRSFFGQDVLDYKAFAHAVLALK